MTDIDSAVQKLTPEQVAGILSGAIVVAPGVAESVRRIHGVTPPAVAVVPVVPVVPPADRRRENEAWLASQAAYEEARDRAEAAGGTPETLNALLAPGETRLPCGLVMRPLTLSGYVFLEAVGSPFVGGGDAMPADLLFLALAVVCPDRASACVQFDGDFVPRVTDGKRLAELSREIGAVVSAADVPELTAHARGQFRQMFPERFTNEGAQSAGEGQAAAGAVA